MAFAVRALTLQAPLSVPDGLPAWAFNIPGKLQPAGVRPEGIVRVPGSAKEYDAAKDRRECESHRIGFPTNIRPRHGLSKVTPEPARARLRH